MTHPCFILVRCLFLLSLQERLLLTNLATLEKEASARQKSQEAYKRKALESQQVSEDLKVTVQKYQSQLKDAQTTVQEKASAFERVSFGHQRLQVSFYVLKIILIFMTGVISVIIIFVLFHSSESDHVHNIIISDFCCCVYD